MKRLILFLWMILGASAFGINITNYPATNAFDGSMTFLLSKASAPTNFNIQADLIASTNWALGTFLPVGGNSVSATYVTTSPLTNRVNIANVDTPGQILTNGNVNAVTFSNAPFTISKTGPSANEILFNILTSDDASRFSVDEDGDVFFDGNLSTANLTFTINGSARFRMLNDDFRPNSDLLEDLGSSTVRWKNYFGSNTFLSGTIMATNGVNLMVKPSFTTNFTCTTNIQTYLCNGTNQIVTLPNAAYVPNVIYRFTSTNGYGSYIVTNATGAQTVRDGVSLSHKQIGIAPFDVFSDGAQWWLAARDQSVEPNAQFSCSTNIPLTLANTAYPVTFNSTDFNNSQGIALALGTNGTHFSKMWITNSGQYEFTPSIVIGMGNVSHTVRYWFRSNDTNIPASTTPTKVGGNDVIVVTVPFVVNITTPTAIEIWAESDGVNDSLAAGAASGNYPASPSVICPVKRISDTWP